jgi:hypothetical protein
MADDKALISKEAAADPFTGLLLEGLSGARASGQVHR